MRKNYFLVFLLFIGITTTLNAQTFTQVGVDIDGEAEGDKSGCSVSLSSDGIVVAIGACRNDGNGYNAGHVRIYQYISGIWTQIGEDIDGEASEDYFGTSVSLSSDGSIVAIGGSWNDGNGIQSGHVRVYQNISGTWTQIGLDIEGEAENDFSGASLCLNSNGTILAIGAHENDGNGHNSGHVRIYKNISGTWTQIGADIDGESEEDKSGCSVSLSSDGSIVAIGAIGNDVNGSLCGHVRIYENIAGNWTQIGADIDGEAENDYSGHSVSLSSDGTVVAIGALNNDGNGSYAGHVRIYQNNAGAWTQIGSDIDGEANWDHSGTSVTLSSDGSIVAIGAKDNYGIGTKSGHVRVYQNIDGYWTKIISDIDGEAVGDGSGFSVSLSSDGSFIAIGAISNNADVGHVRVFSLHSNVGIKDIEEAGILIFPNPTEGIVKLFFAENHIQKLKVSDITGKIVFEKTNVQQNETIDLSGFVNGMYIIIVETEEGNYSSKIIKE